MSQLGSRLVYQNAKALVERAGFSVNQAVLSQSYIRSEVTASTSTAQYRFPILVNDNFAPTFNTMNNTLLALQDAFIISEVGVFVAKPASSTDTNFALFTYLNATVFPTGTLYTLWNGFLQITINNRTILPSWPLRNHYYVPTTQQQTAPYYSANTVPFRDEQHEKSGYSVMEPNVTLVGSKQNEVVINLPSAISTVDSGTRIVLILKGIRAQNVTPVR
jgi:hypothetical protein